MALYIKRCTNHYPALSSIESSDIFVVLEKLEENKQLWLFGATPAIHLRTIKINILLAVIF